MKKLFSTGNKSALSLLLLLLTGSGAFAQFEKSYTPIRFEGIIPQEALRDAAEKTESSLDEGEKTLKVKDQRHLLIAVNYQLSEVFLSGSVYYNDEFTAYVNAVAANLMENDTTGKLSKLHFYVTKFTELNACCWADGSVFVNIGLLARAKNEAQLAYILSHEISHYFCKHSMLSYKHAQQLEDQLNKGKAAEAIFSQLRFSRKNETEADDKGMALYLSSRYDPAEAAKALKLLKDADYPPFRDSTLSMKPLFEKDHAKYDKTYYMTDEEFKKKDSKLKAMLRKKKKKGLGESESTHPDTDKRVAEIQKKADAGSRKQGLKFIADSTTFEHIKMLATFEMLHSNSENANYSRSFYEALQLAKKYPDNVFISAEACNALYWLYIYSCSESIPHINPYFKTTTDKSYARVLFFFSKVERKDLLEISYNYIQKAYAKFPGQEELVILMAEIAEEKDGKKVAAPFYEEYVQKYPTGKHAIYAQEKLR